MEYDAALRRLADLSTLQKNGVMDKIFDDIVNGNTPLWVKLQYALQLEQKECQDAIAQHFLELAKSKSVQERYGKGKTQK